VQKRKSQPDRRLTYLEKPPDRDRLFLDFMDSISDEVYFKDRAGRFVLVNKAFARRFGAKPSQMQGKTEFDFSPRPAAQVMYNGDCAVMRSGRPVLERIGKNVHGQIDTYVSVSKIPRYDHAGKIIGLIGVKRDITCQVQLEHLYQENKAIEKKLKGLKSLDKLKTEFVSVVSHELRTPLSIIREITLILLQGIAGKVSTQQKKLLGRSHANVERLGRLIDDLLDLSRLERGTFKLRYSLVNLKDLLLDSSESFIRLAAQKGVTVRYLFPKRQINIFVDTERFQQVVSNLIINAVKFTDTVGKITVEVKVLADKIRIGVIDTGIGIAKHDLNKLFVRFAQVPTSAQVKKGMGLGLSISKEIVERHGGEVWAESHFGKGSKFYFTLPRFYPLEIIDAQTREKVNVFLAEGHKVHLINILIVNYEKLNRLIAGRPHFFHKVENALKDALREFTHRYHTKAQLVEADRVHAEYSVVVLSAASSLVNQLYRHLKDRLHLYFKKAGIRNCFVNIGLLPYFSKKGAFMVRHVPASIHMKKIYVGLDLRKASRIEYHADVQVFSLGKKVELSKTIDISEHGLCYISGIPLTTDTKIKLKLSLGTHKGAMPVVLYCTVAWIKAVGGSKRRAKKYMVGLEFTRVLPRDRLLLTRFIRSISA